LGSYVWPGQGIGVWTTNDVATGAHPANVYCEDGDHNVLKTYTFQQTITAPSRQLDFDRNTVRPGSTVVIRDGGGCGPYPDFPQAAHVMIFDLMAGGGPVVEVKLPVTAEGRWGPARLTIPAGHPGTAWSVFATCDQPTPFSYPGGGGYRYQNVNIGWP
jgi:hypothetical protein